MSDENQALVAQILSSYLSNNTVSPADLSSVIETVRRAFGAAGTSSVVTSRQGTQDWQPAAPVKKSITPDAIICLCCGESFKSLKRHLSSEHQLTGDAYRTAFQLKPDYPLVAPNYAARRSALAKSLGLGRKAGQKRGSGRKKPGASASRQKAST